MEQRRAAEGRISAARAALAERRAAENAAMRVRPVLRQLCSKHMSPQLKDTSCLCSWCTVLRPPVCACHWRLLEALARPLVLTLWQWLCIIKEGGQAAHDKGCATGQAFYDAGRLAKRAPPAQREAAIAAVERAKAAADVAAAAHQRATEQFEAAVQVSRACSTSFPVQCHSALLRRTPIHRLGCAHGRRVKCSKRHALTKLKDVLLCPGKAQDGVSSCAQAFRLARGPGQGRRPPPGNHAHSPEWRRQQGK